MTTEYRPQTIAMLRAIQEHGPVTLAELEDALYFAAPRNIVVNLQGQGLIESMKRRLERLSYRITKKGIRLLATLDAGKGEVAKPRERVSYATYTGEAAIPTRPGSQDAYALPSMHLGERIARKVPMLIGSIG